MFLALHFVGAIIRISANCQAINKGLRRVRLVGVPRLANLNGDHANRANRLVMRARMILRYSNNGDLYNDLRFRVLLNLRDLVRSVTPATSIRSATNLLIRGLRLTISGRMLVVAIGRNMDLRGLLRNIRTLALSKVFKRRLIFLLCAFLVNRKDIYLRDQRD